MPVARRAVQFDQGHFELRMSGQRRALLRPEVLDHVVREAYAAVEQLAIASGAVVGDGRL